jgi:hypothetical protein
MTLPQLPEDHIVDLVAVDVAVHWFRDVRLTPTEERIVEELRPVAPVVPLRLPGVSGLPVRP